jgi:hypothetical protein
MAKNGQKNNVMPNPLQQIESFFQDFIKENNEG